MRAERRRRSISGRRGSKTLLLTTTGRKTGKQSTTPLIYESDGDRYVIVASKGGAPEDPGWYLNLQKNPEVELQVKDEVFKARASTAEGAERERLFNQMVAKMPGFGDYQRNTTRQIPVIVLARIQG